MAIASGTLMQVRYFCAPGQTRRVVDRAVASVRAQEFILVVDLPQ